MPQYAILIYANDRAPIGSAELAEHDQHSDDLIASGALVAAYALGPRADARSLRADGMTDGPFTETTEIIAGLGIIEAPDLDTATRIAHGNPAIHQGGGVEVREIENLYTRPAVTEG